jgi:hypothetical protein
MALLKEGQKPGQAKLTDLFRGARRQDIEGIYRLSLIYRNHHHAFCAWLRVVWQLMFFN